MDKFSREKRYDIGMYGGFGLLMWGLVVAVLLMGADEPKETKEIGYVIAAVSALVAAYLGVKLAVRMHQP
jgi:formate-dependent nitrite reductase membrane component NrfD